MPTVENVKSVTDGEGRVSFLMEIRDGVELVTCRATGNSCLVHKTCRVPLTAGDLERILPGTKIPGFVVKVATEPYPYRDGGTGKKLHLGHAYAYKPRLGDAEIGLTPLGK